MTNLTTITMSKVGGLSIPVIRRVLDGEMFVLTHYRDPVAILTADPDTDLSDINTAHLDHLRFLKKPVRDRLWSGEVIGVTMVRDPKPVVYLVPLDASH